MEDVVLSDRIDKNDDGAGRHLPEMIIFRQRDRITG